MTHPHEGILGYIICLFLSLLSFWPKMHLNIENYVIKYHKYMVHKAQWLKVIVVLHPLDIPNNTWESISMDFIVSLPHSKRS